MKSTLSRKISIALLITSIVLLATSFILFMAKKAFVIDIASNTSFASLIVLGFGGIWNHSSYIQVDKYGGNPALAIAFIFIIIALILTIILLYGYASKKFLAKTNLNICVAIVILVLFASITVCFTKTIGLNIYCQETERVKRSIAKYASLTPNVIALIVTSFLSLACNVAFVLIPVIKQKITK